MIGGAPVAATGTIISEEGFTTFFSDDFATNTKGWALGTEWQIGSATVSTGQTYGNPDPGVDYTPTTDNGVAGVVIGGNASTALHDFYYFTSPIINTSTANNLFFEYARWLNSDYTPYMQNTVDVFNGSSWINLWSSGESPGVQDNAWTPQKFDISTYKSASTQIRFGFNVGSDSAFTVSSWNIDDVKLYGDGGSTLPVITVAATDASAAETLAGATTNPGSYTLTRTGSTVSALTVNVALSGTASNGTDYTTIPTTVTFAAGSATALVNLNVIDDTLQEPSETATLTVVGGSGYTVGSLGTPPPSSATGKPITSQSAATITIADNDTPLSNTINAVDTGWYNSTGYHDPAYPNYATGDSTLNDGLLYRDWMAFNLPTFSQPVISAQLKVQAYEYLSADASETYELREVATPVSSLVAGGTGQTAIYNDLADGTSYGSRVFTSADNYQFVTINLNAAAISALNAKSGQTFALGGWLTTLDTIDNSELIFGYSYGYTGDVQLVLTYGTDLPVITVAATDASAGETLAGAATNPGSYTLTRTGSTASALTVNVAMSGTASNGTDYTTIPTTVNFAAGSATAVVPLNVIDDTLFEGTETAILTIGTGTGYTVGTTPSATVNIADNDLPVITVAATDASAGETLAGATTNPGSYTLTRTGSTASALTVNVALSGTATNGTDYTTIPTTVTFAAGSATAVVPLNVIDDTLVEGTETAILTIGTGTGYSVGSTPSATVNIADNDLPVITVAATDASAAETLAGATTNPGSYTLTRTGSTASALTVNVALSGTATNGTDYTTIPTTVNFAAGSATAVVPLNVIDDTLFEGTETAILTIGTGTSYTVGSTPSATVNIADNETPSITLASNYSGVSENGKPDIIYTFTRTGATTSSLTVNFGIDGTATRGYDYSAYGGLFPNSTQGTISFDIGATTAKLVLVTFGDTLKEANESINLTLASGSGYQIGTTTTVKSTIINDDGTLNQQGTAGADYIEVGSTRTLSGLGGNDILIGSQSSEILVGGQGTDTLTGGDNFDTFLFSNSSEGVDTITDFNVNQDIIQVSAAGFGGGLIAGTSLSSDQFSLGTVTASTRFIFNKSTGSLSFDIDGSGSTAAIQIASLTTNLNLTEDNIFVG